MNLIQKYKNASGMVKLFVWIIPIRILLSMNYYLIFQPNDRNIIEFVAYEAGSMILLFLTIPLSFGIYSYVLKSLSFFDIDDKTIKASLFSPIIMIAVIMVSMTYKDTLKQEFLKDMMIFMNPYHIASFVNDSIEYLNGITILNMSGDVFVGYCISVPILGLVFINIYRIFMSLKKVLFGSMKSNKIQKLNLIISSYILIIISIWVAFTALIYFIPSTFQYVQTSNPLIFILDTLYYSCLLWISGSADIAPITSLAKIIVIMATLCNTMFFVIFITGLFVDDEPQVDEERECAKSVPVPPKNTKTIHMNKGRKKKKAQ